MADEQVKDAAPEEAKEAPAAEPVKVPEAKPEKAPAAEPKAAEKPKAAVKLSAEAQKVLESVEKMTVLELADLVKAMEEKFGVSAAAPVAVAAAAPAAAEPVEEKSVFTVVLKAGGDQKINVIKVVRELTELGLKEAKDLVEGAPKTVKENVKKEDAQVMKAKLEEAGATVELQ